MLGKTTNQLLAATEQAVQSKVAQQLQGALAKAVHAGQTIMYSQTGMSVTKKLISRQGDMAEIAAEGVCKLVRELLRQSKMTLPLNVAIPAGVILLCEALDFMERAGKVKVTNDVIAEATKDYSAYIMKLLAVTPEKLAELQRLAQAKAKGEIPQGAAGGVLDANGRIPKKDIGGIVNQQMQGA